MMAREVCIALLVIASVMIVIDRCDGTTTANDGPPKAKKLPKDPMYMTELDLQNLYDQWEEADDEKLPPDELEPHLRPPKVNLAQPTEELLKDPEKMMIASKKGKTVMAFVTVAGNPSRSRTEELTQRWQLGLTNNHIRCERYVIGDDRVIYVFQDGSLAYEAKDYLLDQPELADFAIDARVWHGKGHPVEYPHAKKEKSTLAAGDAPAKGRKPRDEL